MSKVFNVGVIGYGLSAKIFHIPFVTVVPDFKLYAVVQRSPKPDNDAGKDYPGVKVYSTTDELFKDSEVDVVIVTTAPDSHFQLAKQALEAGKNVVVEKPFTPTSAEAQELVDIAQKHGQLLTVYQNRRWDSDFLTLRKYIDDGSLGRIVEYETHFDRHRPDPPADTWKAHPTPGNGAAYDLGTHLMDQTIHLFGFPKRVTGFVGSQRAVNNTGLEDSCTILLHYDDALLATIKIGVVSPEVNQLRFWVRGEKGSFRKYHLDPQEDQLKGGMRPGNKGYAIEPEDRHAVLNTMEDGKIKSQVVPTIEPPTYVEYYRRLAAALKGDTSKIPVDPREAVAVIRLVELAKESTKLGKTLDF